MRHAVAATLRVIVLTLSLAIPALGFEIELERTIGPADGQEISVLSNTDLSSIDDLLQDYVKLHPGQRIRYVQAASVEVFRAIYDEGEAFDLVISSAPDLQMKLANDGFAASIEPRKAGLPAWAQWRDQLFGVGLEPVVTLASRKGLNGLPLPRTRRDLIAMLRENPRVFDGRVASYDPVQSGVGYLLMSQDNRQSESFWRFAEVLGRLNARLFCCSGEMIDELRAGRVVIAYNVVASYAARYAPDDADIVQVAFDDYTLAIIRSALVPKNAPHLQGGVDLLSYLLSDPAQRRLADSSEVALIPGTGPKPSARMHPIRLDSGLLVYHDQLRKSGLLAEWNAAMNQP